MGHSTPRSNQSFSSGWGNRVTVAPEVVSDLTQEDEDVVTPPPNDSLASLSPPVGGHLHSYRSDWQTEKYSNNVLNIITNGYILPFIKKPKLARVPLIHSGYKAHQKDLALFSCISNLFCQRTL